MPALFRQSRRSVVSAAKVGRPAGSLLVEAIFLIAALAANWAGASAYPSLLFVVTSFALFGWTLAYCARISVTGAIILAPLVITRFATLVSLGAIEAGAYMPEVNQLGVAGDASASFTAVTALFFVAFSFIFRRLERPLAVAARSHLLDTLSRALAWPVILAVAAWGALAFLHGLRMGFPLIEGIDRFYYRRFFGSGAVLLLLDNKFILAGLLGVVTAAPDAPTMRRAAGMSLFLALTALYFLFGDKFFTVLTQAVVFAMPYLLPRNRRLGPILLKAAPAGLAALALAGSATLYIYSDYGRLPADRTAQKVGERIAGQGELWFVANHDFRRATAWDDALVARYVATTLDKSPADTAFRNGVETYYFVQHYAPTKLATAFRHNQGWVQLTMGTEAMALVMFGYVGVAVVMLAAAMLLALSSAYLSRAFRSGFPPSVFLAIWAYLQVYFAAQQASLSTVAAPGQIKRFLLFAVVEIGLFAINRSETMIGRRHMLTLGRPSF